MNQQLTGKTAIVTGANQGIGFYTALGIAKHGAEVVMMCRDSVRGQAALEALQEESGNNKISLILADFASFRQVKAAADEFLSKHDRLHLLVNNAGAIIGKRTVTPDGYELTFQSNHLSPFLLTNLLLDTIKRSSPARIVNVSSMGHFGGHMNFDDLMGQKMYNEFGAYAQSKLANILFTKHLAKMLEGTGVVVNAVHPGVVHTGFAQGGTYMSKFFYNVFGFAMDTPEKGARTSLHAALSEEGGRVTGQYFSGQKVKTPSREARDPEIAARLWDVSMKLTGLAK